MARAAAKSHVPTDSSDRAVNARVAAVFSEIADLLELEGSNPFRIRAYRNAAHDLGAHGRDLGAMVAAGEDLTELPGVGEDLAGKIGEIVDTGSCAMLDELHATWPASIHDVMSVPGVGPKRARTLFEKLEICTLADLQAAAAQQKIRELPGFGATSERNILDGLAGVLGTGRRVLLSDARVLAERMLARLRAADGVIEAVIAGSYRRALATVGDLDFLVTASARNRAIAALVSAPDVAHVLAEGSTRGTVVMRSGLHVDLRVVARDCLGAALHYFTGSKAHNIAVRRLGVAKGLKTNEYGVFRGERRIAGRTEESVFAAVGLPFIPPELRENRGEIAAARAGTLPQLVAADDLRGDLVIVPAASEPSALVAVAARAARARGLAYLIVVHEVPARPRAAVDWDARLRAAAEACGEHELALLQGLECDVSAKTCPEVHADFTAARLAHPPRAGARASLLRIVQPSRGADETRDPTSLVRACAGGLLAVVGEPSHLPELEPQLRAAREAGVAVVLGSGGEPGGGQASRLDLALSQARRAWIEAQGVVNTRPLAEVRRLLAAPRASRRRGAHA